MQIERLSIGALKAAEYNPRKDLKPGDPEFEKLKRSIEEFGYVEPVIVNKRTGYRIVGGHQRYKVLKHLGHAEVDCVIVDIDEQKEKALNIALNKISGEWDDALLSSLLKDLEQSGFDLELTGFDMAEVKEIFGSGSIENAHEDNFDAEKALEETTAAVTKPGDVWYLGKHRLLCGDCTKPEEIAKLMAGKYADLMVTDPPYNVNYTETVTFRNRGDHNSSRTANDIANDNMSDADFYQFLLGFFNTAYGVMKGGAAAYIFHSSRESVNFNTAMKAVGFKISQTLTWVKNHFTLGRCDYQNIIEPILYGWKTAEGCPHYFIDDRTLCTAFEDAPTDIKRLTKDEMRALIERIFGLQTDALRCDKPAKSPDHPCLPYDEKVFIDGRWMKIGEVKNGQKSEYGTVSQITEHTAPTLTLIRLKDGVVCTATPNHPFLILRENDVAWCEAGKIKKGDKVLCNTRVPRLKVSRKKDISGSVSTGGKEWNTMLYGKLTTGKFPWGTTSTTSTGSESIIELKTSLLSTKLNISGYTPVARLETACGGNPAQVAGNSIPLKAGFISCGTDAHIQSVNDAMSTRSRNAEIFELREVGSVRTTQKTTQVYNLSIDGIPAFDTVVGVSHNTMKPIMLCAKLIYNSSREGELIYEPFGGSGSTLIAAAQLNRVCYACEIDERYCTVIAKRFKKEFPGEEIRLFRGNKEIGHGL